MLKQKQYDWKDSNLALFGSDLDKQVKKEAAEQEPAWRPVLESDQPQLFVWRIEKFKVKSWPKDQYGKFYDGDSYIVLNSFMENDKLCYDVHFWIGRNSTADEYGTAAYKTVELDTLLDDAPVQHREVQARESDLMRSYFPEITYLAGGSPSGFRHVTTQEYTPRLFRFKGQRRNIVVSEVPLSKQALDSTDVYILDLGNRAYQWNSAGASKDERYKATQYLQKLKSERNGRLEADVIDQEDTDDSHEFYASLTEEDADAGDEPPQPRDSKRMMKLTDSSGDMQFDEIANGSLPKESITEDDVYIIDNGRELFVYVGKDASVNEKRNAMAYAHRYLQGNDDPLLPVTVVTPQAPARTRAAFDACF